MRKEKALFPLLCLLRRKLAAIQKSHTATAASISFWDSSPENRTTNSSDTTISILRLGENTFLLIIKVLSV